MRCTGRRRHNARWGATRTLTRFCKPFCTTTLLRPCASKCWKLSRRPRFSWGTHRKLSMRSKLIPALAMREQVLEAFAPTAVQLGHPQEAIDALEAYSGTASKPTLLFDRAH